MKNKNAITEELNRYKTINRYVNKYVMEQELPVDPNAVPAEPTADPNAGLPPVPTGETPSPEQEPNPTGEVAPEVPETPETPEISEPTSDDTTEEIDITDLVNMTKNIKKQLEDKSESPDVSNKMNDIFTKLNDLENKLGEMDSVIQKIDQIGDQINKIKPQTPVEKLEMRSLDSYPFNQKPSEFFNQKQDEMKMSGKNEYVLTKDDVENYSKNQITQTFNPFEDGQQFNAVKF